MFVRNHMTRDPVCVLPDATLREIVHAMARRRIRHIPILNEDNHVLGIISDHEIRVAADHPGFWEMRAHEVMSRSPLTVESNVPFGRALTHLCAHGADVLLVLERGVLVGILTRADFLRAFSQALALDIEGSSVEVSLSGPADVVTAVDVLHRHGAEIKSAVAARIRDDGDEAVFFVRLTTPDPRAVEAALADAGLILLVPEEDMLANDGPNGTLRCVTDRGAQ